MITPRIAVTGRTAAFAAIALLMGPLLAAPRGEPIGRVVEIRSYNLKPGTRAAFHERFVRESLPLLRQAKVDVVAYGPSLQDADTYYLMRAYASVEERQRSEDAFYGSDAWKNGPREATLADIENYTTLVLPLDEAAIQELRALRR